MTSTPSRSRRANAADYLGVNDQSTGLIDHGMATDKNIYIKAGRFHGDSPLKVKKN
jgi:hypothetical protein